MLLLAVDQIIVLKYIDKIFWHFRYDYKLVWSPDEYGGSIVKPWPQTPKPQTLKPKTKGPWADTKISWATTPPHPPHNF